jgi:hypothetical protein
LLPNKFSFIVGSKRRDSFPYIARHIKVDTWYVKGLGDFNEASIKSLIKDKTIQLHDQKFSEHRQRLLGV